jgi:hypothetical protein
MDFSLSLLLILTTCIKKKQKIKAFFNGVDDECVEILMSRGGMGSPKNLILFD